LTAKKEEAFGTELVRYDENEMSKIRRVEYQRRAVVDNEEAPSRVTTHAHKSTQMPCRCRELIQATMPTLPYFLIWGGR